MYPAAPLSSPAFLAPSISGLQRATSDIAKSAARLSTGNRLINAGDDVAALSISTRLRSQVVGVKAAQSNVTQGNSFLQVAAGGLTTIRDILDRMNALAVQANSGSLTTTDRELLQQEFAALEDEVDRIAENTEFNGIKLLDGTVSGANTTTTSTTQATQAEGSITLTGLPTAGQTVIINGVTFTARAVAALSTEFTIGGTIAATATNLANVLNAYTGTAISQATYDDSGNSVLIEHDSGGELGNQFLIQANGTASYTVSGDATQSASFYSLEGGENDGLHTNSVQVSGSVGDALVNTQSQIQAYVTLTFSGAAVNGETLTIDNGNAGVVTFTFATTASLSTDIQIGANTEETIQNIITTVSQYDATNDYGTRQLEFQADGNQLIIRNKNVGDPADFVAGADLDIGETLTNGSLSATSFSNGATTGVNTSGVNNGDFIGTLDGFSAEYVGADSLTASITVGSSTYTAAITDTTPASNTVYRFHSTDGGYFDVQLSTSGESVADQDDADTFAARLNTAFSTLTFYQARNVTNFEGTGDLAGASAQIKLDDFTSVRIKDISVTAPVATDATIDITVEINGTEEIFRASSGLGESVGEGETITFTSLADGNRTIRLTAGSSGASFSDDDEAAAFEEDLRTSFGLDEAGTGLDFQVGTGSDDSSTINVNIGDARTSELFSGASPSISTQNNAEDAIDTIEAALNRIGDIMADVGALQSRFDAAFTNLESTRINVDAARSALADTDIAEESTSFALATLRANAATAAIAQATRLQSGLLDILRVSN